MTSGDLTLGAVLVRLEEREREIAEQAEETRGQITRLTAVLDELGRAAEEVRITRKTLLELPDPGPPAPSASAPKLPDGRPTRRSWRCSPRQTVRYGHGACARRWTWTRLRTTSTTSV